MAGDDFIDLGDVPDAFRKPAARAPEEPPPAAPDYDPADDPSAAYYGEVDEAITLEDYRARAMGRGPRRTNGHATDVDMPLYPITGEAWIGEHPKPRQWVVAGWIPQGHVTGLYAPGGTGKTLLAQQLLTCIAAGKPFLGLETHSGPVFGLFCEDDFDELHRRQVQICEGMELDLADFGANLHVVSRIGCDNTLMAFPSGVGDPGEVTPLWHQLRALLEEIEPVLVVVDTASDVFAGNENDRLQPRRFVQACLGRLCRELDTTVITLLHPSRAGMVDKTMESGSTAWRGAFRSQWSIRRPDRKDGDEEDDYSIQKERILKLEKSNYAQDGMEIRLQWNLGVLTPYYMPTGAMKAAEENRIAKMIEHEMRRLTDLGHVFSASPRSPSHPAMCLGSLSKAIKGERNITRGLIERVINALIENGTLKIGQRQRNKGPRQQIVFADQDQPDPDLFGA